MKVSENKVEYEKSSVELSIILPVYNVEKYLEKCLETMLNQKYQNFELIIVNDGTKDNSEEIILKYANDTRYMSKIKYIKKENGGLSDARNYGYKEAEGKYVTFFDSDDYISEYMYLNIMKKVKEFNYDVIVSDLYMEYEDINSKNNSKNGSFNKLVYVSSNVKSDNKNLSLEDKKELLKNMYIAVHNKIYKKEVIDRVFGDIPFIKGMLYEDICFTYKLIPNINSIARVEEPLYYYMQREGSISNTYSDKLNDILKSIEIIETYYKENKDGEYCLLEKYKDEIEYITVRYYFGTYMQRLAKAKNLKKYILEYKNVKKYINNKYKNYKNNIYLKKAKGIKNKLLKIYNLPIAILIYILETNRELSLNIRKIIKL